MTQIKTTLLCLIAATALAGCETVQGAGRDIQKAGQALTNTVN